MHVRVNIEAFEQQLNYLLHEQGSIRPVVSNRFDTTGQINLIPQVKSITETTSETTAKEKIAPASGAVSVTEKKERPRDLLFDAVQVHIFGIPLEEKASGGRIAKISNWLNGKYEGRGAQTVGKISKAAEPQHVEKFAAWCHREGFTPPLDVVKFTEQWRKWAAAANGSAPHRSDPLAGLTIITNDPAVTP